MDSSQIIRPFYKSALVGLKMGRLIFSLAERWSHSPLARDLTLSAPTCKSDCNLFRDTEHRSYCLSCHSYQEKLMVPSAWGTSPEMVQIPSSACELRSFCCFQGTVVWFYKRLWLYCYVDKIRVWVTQDSLLCPSKRKHPMQTWFWNYWIWSVCLKLPTCTEGCVLTSGARWPAPGTMRSHINV